MKRLRESLQECFNVSGHDCTMGLAQLIGQPATRDSSFVSGMKELQAVPFCLTNIPQTVRSWERLGLIIAIPDGLVELQ